MAASYHNIPRGFSGPSSSTTGQTSHKPFSMSQLDVPFMNASSSEPWVEITEQPKATGMRFRYECEGRSAGTILGVNAAGAHKSYPTIKIHNGGTGAVVVVSCVTKNRPYYPHPHSLIGKSCNDSVCTLRVKSVDTISMLNVGIQCCKRNDVPKSIETRKRIRVDPFGTGYITDIDKLDLGSVRLCFQVFLLDPNTKKFSRVVPPVVSEAIVDKKLINTLTICRLSKRSSCARGDEEVILLCDKIKKDDVEVRFFEEDSDGETVWEAFGTFSPHDIHHQCAISFKTPPYRKTELENSVTVQLQLRRPSDGGVGELKEFQYIPNYSEDEKLNISRKRKLVGDHFASTSTEVEAAISTLSSFDSTATRGQSPRDLPVRHFNKFESVIVPSTVTDHDDRSSERLRQNPDLTPLDFSTSVAQQHEQVVPAADKMAISSAPLGTGSEAGYEVLENGTIMLHATADGRVVIPQELIRYLSPAGVEFAPEGQTTSQLETGSENPLLDQHSNMSVTGNSTETTNVLGLGTSAASGRNSSS